MNTATLLTGYRGSKVHAVDSTTARNAALGTVGEGFSLCGWGVQVGEQEFRPMAGLTCKACERAARR